MEGAFKKRKSKAGGVKVVAAPGDAGAGRPACRRIAEGLGVTMRHFVKNFGNVSATRKTDIETIAVPRGEDALPRALPRPAPPDAARRRQRPLRRLHDVPDRRAPPTASPSSPRRARDGRIEKRPAIFEIDELRCVVCGLCVEACPCDAIRMDTGVHAKPTERRFEAVLGKTDLMSRGTQSIAVQGGKKDWRDTEKTP